jgi:hypothetical protein
MKANSSWNVRVMDPETKRRRFVGSFASEEDAAKAYDCAAVQARGPGAKRNFPGDAISEPPVSKGEEQKQRKSSRYVGVIWDTANSSWKVQLWDRQTKRPPHRFLRLRGGRGQGVRLRGCAGARTRCPAQLPRRGDQRAACVGDSSARSLAASQLPLSPTVAW